MDRPYKFDFCRICLRQPETNREKRKFLNILNTKVNRVELRQIILDLLTVNVKESDLLPKIICPCCYTFLVKWFETELKLKNAEKVLKENRASSNRLSDRAKSSAKKTKRLTSLQRHLCKKTTENQLLMLNILKKMNELEKQEETQSTPKTSKSKTSKPSVTARQDIGSIEPIEPNEPLYCICNQVEYGKMIACDSKECPYKWFHYECIDIVDTPKGKWHCDHCATASAQ